MKRAGKTSLYGLQVPIRLPIRKLSITILPLFLTVCFVFLTSVYSRAYAQEFAVVANPSAPEVSIEDIKKIYLGVKKTLPDGTKAIPLLMRGIPDEFYTKVIGLTKTRFVQHWMTKIVEGLADPPKSVQTEDELVSIIKENKGAIGVLPLYKAKSEGLKILLIIK